MKDTNISKTVYLFSGIMSCAAFCVAGIEIEGENPNGLEIVSVK